MRVIDLENINSAMGNETQFVLRCEEVFHDKISAAAAAAARSAASAPARRSGAVENAKIPSAA